MTAPGWYPDPSDPSRQRYFDGTAWTDSYAAVDGPTQVVGQSSKSGISTGKKIGLGIGAAGLALIALNAVGNSNKTVSSSPTTITVTKTVGAAPTQPARTGPVTSFSGDGTYLIGQDIEPGRYRSGGGAGGRDDCYWQRQSSVGGGGDAIIASDLAEGQQIVDILPTDVAFQSKHCQTWEKIG